MCELPLAIVSSLLSCILTTYSQLYNTALLIIQASYVALARRVIPSTIDHKQEVIYVCKVRHVTQSYTSDSKAR